MKMVLCSQSFIPRLAESLQELLGESLSGKRIALIPNAGVGTEKQEMCYQALREFSSENNMYIKLVDLENMKKEWIVESIKECDILSMTGGFVSRLVKEIDKAGVRKLIVETIENGRPFVGFSAGSMVMSKTSYFASEYLGEPDLEVDKVKTLGVVDFEIYPHFRDENENRIRLMKPDSVRGYGIYDDEAVVVEGDDVKVLGGEKIL